MKTGIVFRIEGRKAIVLKSNGTFVSVDAKNGWKVGETVPVSSVSRSRMTHFLAMAACLAMVVVGSFGWKFYTAPVALISLDVNPSIELSVNRFDRIVSATALNDEGTQILTETNIKNTAYQEALVNVLNAEGISEYLTTGTDVVLTVFAQDLAVQTSLLAELQGVVDSSVSSYSHQIRTEYHAVNKNMVNGAHGHGVTAGKYLYLQELQELAPEINISQFTHHSIEQIKGEIETCHQKSGMGAGDSHHNKNSAGRHG